MMLEYAFKLKKNMSRLYEHVDLEYFKQNVDEIYM